MLENATVSWRKSWGTMPFSTGLSRGGRLRFREDAQGAGTWNVQENQSVCEMMCRVQ